MIEAYLFVNPPLQPLDLGFINLVKNPGYCLHLKGKAERAFFKAGKALMELGDGQ
ncbi:hypothetical protein H6G96_09625 [Nostoc sp. FACHB-892]|uniref:hypothetical protein n=1 Tax=Nostoc sp. FACHB-892 TaxID=2692843 RepID=UPI0016897616|nr:hypothetical protein [Nostoc sp. FACHB-892]MBD2726582.1 hypothetical protein [Nostoc sp. FACHB-892]